MIPEKAPPKKLVEYIGIGLAEIMSDWVNGSIATDIISFLEPNFNFANSVEFIKAEPKAPNAPIAIGRPVRPIIDVRAIELSGDVPTTVIRPPSIIPIIIGLMLVASIKTCPICSSVLLTNGSTFDAIRRDSGAHRRITTTKSTPGGTFFSINLIKKETKYPATNPDNIEKSKQDNPIKTA